MSRSRVHVHENLCTSKYEPMWTQPHAVARSVGNSTVRLENEAVRNARDLVPAPFVVTTAAANIAPPPLPPPPPTLPPSPPPPPLLAPAVRSALALVLLASLNSKSTSSRARDRRLRLFPE